MKYSEEAYSAIKAVISSKMDITKTKFNIEDYKEKRAEYYKKIIENSLKKIRENAGENHYLKLWNLYRENKLSEMLPVLDEIKNIEKEEKKERLKLGFSIPRVPLEIRDEVNADLAELHKCFENGCFRSTIILCGRVLETALHRKYYEITGRDILETSPGIGLGNLVAKMKELQFNFDPGISEQIHLINQVRIYSVHKKQEPFNPSKEQAHAIILYTIDVVKKMF
jgi:hypothetical protein